MEQRNQNQNQQRGNKPAANNETNPNDPQYEKNRPFAKEQKRQDSDKR
jgi:hypothetical protein